MIKKKLPIAFFSDKHMIPGLHVSLASLLMSLSPEFRGVVELYLFLDQVGEKDQDLLRETHSRFGPEVSLRIQDFSPEAPTGGNALNGNQTVYGRLCLPELLSGHERCVYLDSDLYVNRCVGGLIMEIDEKNVIVVDGDKKRSESYDRSLFEAANISTEGPYFNSGVMGINLVSWRRAGISQKCMEVAERYAGMFVTADQAVLNVALHDSFKSLGKDINYPLFPPTITPCPLEAKIYHFVGSPKPWDLFGSMASRQYGLWNKLYKKTAIGNVSTLKYASLSRTFSVTVSTAKALRSRLRGNHISG